MIRSMTGFGTAEGAVGANRVTVELRSVNHRFFNPSIKLPSSLTRWEADVREALRKAVSRGHVTLTARLDRGTGSAQDLAAVDETRFATYVERLRQLRDRYHLDGPIDVATILRMPDVVATSTDDAEGSAAELVEVVERAAAALTESREAEGRRLAEILLERIGAVEASIERLAERAPQRLAEHRDRLRASVAELAGNVQLDEQRLAQEIALLADRLDVGEELDRFRTHLAAFREAIVKARAESVGRRLTFLLQELLREANTTGSKSNDAAMTREVVAIKEELERIREQVENLE